MALGAFFFASYGFANWIASGRADVPSVAFAWERSIPFYAWTILPYWTIDAFYAASFFVCSTRSELDRHAKRLLLAQVISVSCFLLLPLRFGFERPPTDGWAGWMFDVLSGFDQPFNQAPSLHIALLVILWLLYLRHVPAMWRWLVHGWSLLIGLSVLTTYQHHFIDVPTGALVGFLCVWLVPEAVSAPYEGARFTEDASRRRIAAWYGAGAIVASALAVAAGGWALWLLWAGCSLAIVSAIYAFLDERAFQKGADGTIGIASTWLLAPYLAGVWINSRWWTRASPAAALVAPGVYIGRVPATRREREAGGILAIVDLSAELRCAAAGVAYVNIPQLDLTVPSEQQLARAAEAIERESKRGPVLVCCALGLSRSAAAVAAWLLQTRRAGAVADAVDRIRGARPSIVLGPGHLKALAEFFQQQGRVAG